MVFICFIFLLLHSEKRSLLVSARKLEVKEEADAFPSYKLSSSKSANDIHRNDITKGDHHGEDIEKWIQDKMSEKICKLADNCEKQERKQMMKNKKNSSNIYSSSLEVREDTEGEVKKTETCQKLRKQCNDNNEDDGDEMPQNDYFEVKNTFRIENTNALDVSVFEKDNNTFFFLGDNYGGETAYNGYNGALYAYQNLLGKGSIQEVEEVPDSDYAISSKYFEINGRSFLAVGKHWETFPAKIYAFRKERSNLVEITLDDLHYVVDWEYFEINDEHYLAAAGWEYDSGPYRVYIYKYDDDDDVPRFNFHKSWITQAFADLQYMNIKGGHYLAVAVYEKSWNCKETIIYEWNEPLENFVIFQEDNIIAASAVDYYEKDGNFFLIAGCTGGNPTGYDPDDNDAAAGMKIYQFNEEQSAFRAVADFTSVFKSNDPDNRLWLNRFRYFEMNNQSFLAVSISEKYGSEAFALPYSYIYHFVESNSIPRELSYIASLDVVVYNPDSIYNTNECSLWCPIFFSCPAQPNPVITDFEYFENSHGQSFLALAVGFENVYNSNTFSSIGKCAGYDYSFVYELRSL